MKLTKPKMTKRIVMLLVVAGCCRWMGLAQSNVEQKIDAWMRQMTLAEKVALCHAQSKFSSAGVPRLGIPEIWMSDGPHGVREEIGWDTWSPAGWTNDRVTAFPALTCLAATFNPDLARAYGLSVGEEARYREKDILLGPGVNIYRTPLNGRNFEYMGEDPWLASRMVVPYVQGVQTNGVSACVKHFALNDQEDKRTSINVKVSDRALYEIYLPPFKAAVQEGKAWSVMGAYNKYQDQYCCANDRLLRQILKGEWGFDGVVVSDWGGVHDTKETAINGMDIEMGSYTNGMTSGKESAYEGYYLARPFREALTQGTIPMSVLDDKVRRILRLSLRTNLNPNRPYGRLSCPDHSAVARAVADEGIVLLKNNGLLPLVPGSVKKIAVIGENATRSLTMGGGSSELKVKYEISPLEGLQLAYGADNLVYSKGYASGSYSWDSEIAPKEDLNALADAAVECARQADVVIFVGGLNKNHFQDCEGADRKSMDLPFGQNALLDKILAVNKKVVVVLLSGNAVSLPWVDRVPAILQGWYLGSEAGNGLADVLSGKVNPSGKLPFTFPKKLEDVGAHHFGTSAYPGDGKDVTYAEDVFVGYRWFDHSKIAPQFAFGHGLSYTTFAFGKPTVDKADCAKGDTLVVRCTLTNTGSKAGAEVVQLYVSPKHASVPRPVKELKAFQKVFLNAGERKEVVLRLAASALSYYSETAHDWVLEPGAYDLCTAASAADVRGQVTVKVH
jgi:beta-glucosidase